jgi:serine/threonine-protein kinase
MSTGEVVGESAIGLPSEYGPAKPSGEVDLGELPRRLGRYEILARLGAGGMGTVFRARQIPMERIVAVKVLASSLAKDKRYLRRFVREARAAGALDHPNIVQVHDVGNAEGHPYICMEYIDGCSVEQLLRERKRLAPVESVEVAIRVGEALEHAHDAGIIHCDIKPDNIMVDKRGMAKLADLGLARQHSASGAESGTFHGIGMGTPHYVSLEQARDIRNADARSDIYSLGTTLFHMVTGRVPYDGKSIVDIVMRGANEPLDDPCELAPGVPRSLGDVIKRMMAKSPADRYQDASSALHDLRAVRAELAGLGPADLLGVMGPPRPVKGPGGIIYVLAASIAAVSLAGAVAAGLRGGSEVPPPIPQFFAFEESVAEPDLPGETPPPHVPDRVEDPVTPDPRATPPVPPVEPPEPENTIEPRLAAEAALNDVVWRAKWLRRAGRYADAEAALKTYAAVAPDEQKARALEHIAKLHAQADEEAQTTLALADELLATGRIEKAISLLTWAGKTWGLPVLEARADDALASARRVGKNFDERRRTRARAETAARRHMQRATELAAQRRFTTARRIVQKAIDELAGAASPRETSYRRRLSVLEMLAKTHARMVEYLNMNRKGLPAKSVLEDWPSADAVFDGATKERLYISHVRMRAGRRWADLSAVDYARLVERVSRLDNREEALGAGFAWLEAKRPEEALRVFKASATPPKDIPDMMPFGETASVLQSYELARAMDASGREREALRELSRALEGVPQADHRPAGIDSFAASLRRSVDLGAGLWASVRRGPADMMELVYDFSREESARDWRTSGARLRRSSRGIVCASGGRCALTFEGPFVAGWEVAVSLRFMESSDCYLEVVSIGEHEDATPRASARLAADELRKGADGTSQPPLAREVFDVIVFRRWDEIRYGVGRGSALIRLDRRSDAQVPDGPERIVLKLGGWVELQRVRLRGVLDPAWFDERRARVAAPDDGGDRALVEPVE